MNPVHVGNGRGAPQQNRVDSNGTSSQVASRTVRTARRFSLAGLHRSRADSLCVSLTRVLRAQPHRSNTVSAMPVPMRADILSLKPQCWDKQMKTMCDAAERVRVESAGGGARAFTPKDLELFEANDYMKKSCYRRYDKITNAPDHGELPAWDIPAWRVARLMPKG